MDGGKGGVWVCGCVGVVPYTHACTHTHMHVKHVVNMINMDASMSVQPFAISIHVYMCVGACACVWGHPHALRHPTHLPPPQSHREPKTPKFNNSQTNRDNSILFEDSLPLNTPESI